MESIKVKFSIWDIVEHSFNENKYKVIWYEYIGWRWIRYICSNSVDYEKIYLYEIELKTNKDTEIGFIF